MGDVPPEIDRFKEAVTEMASSALAALGG
jgi:hypothetical protein